MRPACLVSNLSIDGFLSRPEAEAEAEAEADAPKEAEGAVVTEPNVGGNEQDDDNPAFEADTDINCIMAARFAAIVVIVFHV